MLLRINHNLLEIKSFDLPNNIQEACLRRLWATCNEGNFPSSCVADGIENRLYEANEALDTPV